jgi:hypothetical protein
MVVVGDKDCDLVAFREYGLEEADRSTVSNTAIS